MLLRLRLYCLIDIYNFEVSSVGPSYFILTDWTLFLHSISFALGFCFFINKIYFLRKMLIDCSLSVFTVRMAMLLPNVDMSLSKITKTMKKNNKKLFFFFSLFYYILSMHNFLNCVKPLFLFAFKFIQEKE